MVLKLTFPMLISPYLEAICSASSAKLSSSPTIPNCTAQELVWVGRTTSDSEDAEEEKSRIFFIHRSGGPGSEELHTPAKNISAEMNNCDKICDGLLMIPPRRKKPHSHRTPNSITSTRITDRSLNCAGCNPPLQNWPLTVSTLANRSSPIYTAREANVLSIPPVIHHSS